jgi:hypothetical protein
MKGGTMNHASGTAAADNGGTFGPEQAAALLDQTTQRARRKLQPSPPWLLATRAVMVLAALGAVVAMAVLGAAGVGLATYPTSVLVIPGLAWAALMAARRNWLGLATGIAIVVMGIVGAFAGPAGAWAVAAVGLCAVLLGNAVALTRHQHA